MELRNKDTIDKAITRFEAETGLKMRIHEFNNQRDLIIKIEGYDLLLNTEVRLFLTKARFGTVVNKLKGNRGILLLITEYVNPELRKTIEKNNINFIDTAGNAFINIPPLLINIKGNKLREIKKTKTIEKPFYPAALQTIFTLLCNPGIEKNTVREIAKKAGITHGTVHLTLKDLQRQGYIQIHDGICKIINKEKLLERWVTLYPEKLKPKFTLGKYELKQGLFEELDLGRYGALWGGEEAAARLTKYLRPFNYTIYIVGDRQGEFVLRNRLRKNLQGNLVLIKKFWKFEDNHILNITHPILVYADLLATGDPRNIEAAQIIYEKEIVKYFQ
ncbi:MAG: type IV toxin-antitoxin system AbiEi family antitoxin [Ignavibacteriaceae bacterium]|nr:type IV toxin-antitoxin system AbiEi family antitoxin [Ignavibacteriaceae bacterium]